ncbi:Hexose transporter 4 [Hyphodiscus hymeniophilus]|uniref:Hexose transporter 4 n=1 Tax=Hyphodiscus hymeniophilus TaxID=353542 RepID=A0A9P6SL42_9HELO|nr:Hexose transporter 4 [Hyphodiscus hymeniophilus]
MGFINFRGRSLYRVMSFSCAMAFTLYGYDSGVLAGVQNTKPYLDALGNPQLKSTYIIPMIASSFVLGAWAMSMMISFIGMPMGRRYCILSGDVLVTIGGAIQASSHSVPQIIVGRVLCGFGLGFISSTVPTYMAEMSIKSSERGPEVAFQCAMIISGVLAIISGIGISMLPDTPRWYYVMGRIEEGDQVLSALHDLPIDDEGVQQQKKEILDIIASEASQKPFSMLTLLWDNTELQSGRRLRTAFLITFIQQLMGINLLVYYSTIIFSQIGLSAFLSSLLGAVMNTGFAAGTWFTPSTIERWGRRSILLWTGAACTVFMLIFVVMINLGDAKSTATQWTAVASVILYIFVFGYGWVGIPWLYGPELAPLRYRHLGGSYGAIGEWCGTFLTVFAGGIAIQRIGPLSWILYLLFSSGKTLEEIDEIFMKCRTDIDGGDLGEAQRPSSEKASEVAAREM